MIHSFTLNLWLNLLGNNPQVILISPSCTFMQATTIFFQVNYILQYFSYFHCWFTFCEFRSRKVTFATNYCTTMKSLANNLKYWSIRYLMYIDFRLYLRRTFQLFRALLSFCEKFFKFQLVVLDKMKNCHFGDNSLRSVHLQWSLRCVVIVRK